MMYAGIDLHKLDLVVATETASGRLSKPRRILCRNEGEIVKHFEGLRPFCAVIEASSSYRWLYELLSPMGGVILAHPLRLRAIVSARAKTDKLDAALLARLLRAGLTPEAYIPPEEIHELRQMTRNRARLSYGATSVKNQLHTLLRARNIHPPFVKLFCKSGRRWLEEQELGMGANLMRDELLRRLAHYDEELKHVDACLDAMAAAFPEEESLIDLYGFGRYSALLVLGELGEPERFAHAKQVGAYAGLTTRVHQSGGHAYYGHISKQGSRWLRWVLVQAAIKIVRKDEKLKNFYTRIRKRSGKNVARVAVARKLAEICWVRLRRWHREHAA
ncbi:MAG: IS110 family transposase [bacterium]|nr:IS110 family transposase [bacterium]